MTFENLVKKRTTWNGVVEGMADCTKYFPRNWLSKVESGEKSEKKDRFCLISPKICIKKLLRSTNRIPKNY